MVKDRSRSSFASWLSRGLILALGACATPGVEIRMAPTDFAFVEVDLRG